MIDDRTSDCLPDPPRRIGREPDAAAVVELLDRVHQAQIALLDQIQQLQGAMAANSFGDPSDEVEMTPDHLLFSVPDRLSCPIDLPEDMPQIRERKPSPLRDCQQRFLQLGHLGAVLPNELLPARLRKQRQLGKPVRVVFMAKVAGQQLLSGDAAALTPLHQLPIQPLKPELLALHVRDRIRDPRSD